MFHTLLIATKQGDPSGPFLMGLNTSGNWDVEQPVHGYVTSMFAVEGGLVAAYTDGTVTGPDDAFGDLSLSNVAPAGDGLYFGYSGPDPFAATSGVSTASVMTRSTASSPSTMVLVSGPRVGRSTSRWQSTLGDGANSSSWVPLDTARLWQLALAAGIINPDMSQGAKSQRVGEAFEGTMLRAIIKQKNTQTFTSLKRRDQFGTSGVIPDAVAPFVRLLPPAVFSNSNFIEFKAVRPDTSLSLTYQSGQLTG